MTSLDPQAQALLDAAKASGLPAVYDIPVAEARVRMHAAFTQQPVPAISITDMSAGEVNLRCYDPSPSETVPALVFFHGGGWVVNDLDTHDRLCALLAERACVRVFSVDIPSSPESKYPGAIEVAAGAYEWIFAHADELHVDSGRLYVGGDSSGGTIAAVIAERGQSGRVPAVAGQILFYPVTDFLHPVSDSYRDCGVGYSLDANFMRWAFDHYLPVSWDREDPELFPLRSKSEWKPAPTFITTAQFDPLRSEGIAYAGHLLARGGDVVHVHADSQMHGFAMQTTRISRADELVAQAALWLSSHARNASLR